MSVKIFYLYTYLKRYYSLVFSYTFSQVKKLRYHTLKRNCCNCLYINFLGVFLIGVSIFTMGIMCCTQATWFKIHVLDIYSNINICLYFIQLVLLVVFVYLYGFIIKNILLIKSISKVLPKEFISTLSNKIKIKDRFIYIFSLKFLKIFLLTNFFVLLLNLSYYIYFDSFLSPDISIELFIYILYISVCYNFSYCCINRVKFFSKYNICSVAYSFILLLLAKITVINLIMPLLLPYILLDNKYTGINKHIDFLEKNTLKFLKRFPIIHKLVSIKINNNVFLNSSIAKLRCSSIYTPLNNSNAKYIPKINFSALTMYNSKPNSVIISAIQSANKISSCLMFTYNDRSSFIAIDRLSVVNIPSANTQILRVDILGFLPKSGYFNKSNIDLAIEPKTLEISAFSSNNVLLKNKTCSKPFSESAIVKKGVYEFTVENKQEIPLSSDISDLLANLKKYSLNKKIDNFINNISPDLLNPFVFMVNLPGQNPENNEFNNGGNKGKQKATDEEIRSWDEQDRVNSQELVQMDIDTDTSILDIFEDEAFVSLMTPDELALQSSFIDFYNTLDVVDVDYELLKTDLSIYEGDLVDISSSIDYFASKGAPVNLDSLYIIPPAMYRLKTEYPSFFDEDSGNKYNVVGGLTDLNDYITHERKAAISEFMKEKSKNISQNTVNEEKASAESDNTISTCEPVVTDENTSESVGDVTSFESLKPSSLWERLHYSSNDEYEDAVRHRFDEICAEYYKDNRGDDINVRLVVTRARAHVVRNRIKELGDEYNSISDILKHNTNSRRATRAKDPSYSTDRSKIIRDKTLSAKDKQIQLQARLKLHKDILKEHRTKNKNKH